MFCSLFMPLNLSACPIGGQLRELAPDVLLANDYVIYKYTFRLAHAIPRLLDDEEADAVKTKLAKGSRIHQLLGSVRSTMPAQRGRGVQSIVVGGRLLNALVESAQPMMLKDLAAAADVPPAQAHAYLRSFREIGLIEQDANGGRYQLGPFALQLGLVRLSTFNPLRWIDQAALDFSLKWGCLVSVAVWGNAGPTVVQVHEGPREMNINVRPGRSYSLIDVAVGRVFGAFLPRDAVEPQIREELQEGTRHAERGTPDTFEEWLAIADTIRRNGYAAAENSPSPGINAICAPVFDHNGLLQYAFNVVGFARRVDSRVTSPIVKDLLGVTRGISVQLGKRLHD